MGQKRPILALHDNYAMAPVTKCYTFLQTPSEGDSCSFMNLPLLRHDTLKYNTFLSSQLWIHEKMESNDVDMI